MPVTSSSPARERCRGPGPGPGLGPGFGSGGRAGPAPAAGRRHRPPASARRAAYPYLVGGPGIGASIGMSTSAQRKAPEPDIAAAAAAAAASAREEERARRRRRAGDAMTPRGYRYEFLDLNVGGQSRTGIRADREESATSTVASDQGAGNLGFAGTARKETSSRRRGWPRWPVTGSAAGRQSRWCRAPGSPYRLC